MTEKQTRNLFNLQPDGRLACTSGRRPQQTRRITGHTTAAIFFLAAFGIGSSAQTPTYQAPKGGFNAPPAPQLQLPPLPTPVAITANGKVVEDVIARINDRIITRSEYERAREQLVAEAQQQQAPPAETEDRLNNMLRDMIDQQLLLSKGKELGITCDADVIRRLDDIRKQNHLDSMEALEKAATSQGVSFEDFKQGIRNNCITQKVVSEEVGRRLAPTHAQEEAFYAAHSKDFEQPEQVHLSEILIPTPDNPTDAQITEAQAKADAVAAKLKAGAKFADVAKESSGGPTASAGGDLGDFGRGKLGDVLENATFSLPVGGVTAPIRTRQGFVILRVDAHQAAGVPPLEQIEPQVQEGVYMDALQPALRAYLTKARQDAYVDIKAGFIDTGSPSKLSKPAFTAYAPPPIKKKNLARQKAEQERAARAAAELAAAREKVAEKQAEKAAADAQKSGVKNVSMPVKPKKIHKEKIRFGQAPRNSLPAGTTLTTEESVAPIAGVAPGVAMAPTESVTSISSGTGVDADADPLTPKAGPEHKSRFAARQSEQEEQAAQAKLAKAEVKATTRPIAATPQQSETEKTQAAPLGLNGDTVKKQKPKKDKNAPKERLEQKTKPAEEPAAPIAPTVNPALGTGAGTTTPAPASTPAPATPPAPASTPQ
jgi:peptidyl-prolyl cis-trans isomerase SurA